MAPQNSSTATNNSTKKDGSVNVKVECQMEIDLDSYEARIEEMKNERERLNQMQAEVNKQMNLPARMLTLKEKMENDKRSIYVGNVDYGTTEKELKSHFEDCGAINRLNIMCNKYSGHPKGFAYIEFSSEESVEAALLLHESLFRGRQIKVMSKRTNQPGMCKTNKFPGAMKRERGVFKRKPAQCPCKCSKKFGSFKAVNKRYHGINHH